MAVFVWTFHGVMEAIALGVVLLGFALVGLLVAWVKLLEWWERRRRKPNARPVRTDGQPRDSGTHESVVGGLNQEDGK